jgi:hypothetical protein
MFVAVRIAQIKLSGFTNSRLELLQLILRIQSLIDDSLQAIKFFESGISRVLSLSYLFKLVYHFLSCLLLSYFGPFLDLNVPFRLVLHAVKL